MGAQSGFASLSMERAPNLSFLAPELIAKGVRSADQLYDKVGEWW